MNEEKMIVVKSACVDPQVRLRYLRQLLTLPPPTISVRIAKETLIKSSFPQGKNLRRKNGEKILRRLSGSVFTKAVGRNEHGNQTKRAE